MASDYIKDGIEKMEKLRISREEEAFANFFPLQMVRDELTEIYVKSAKVMVIIQGPYSDSRVENCEKIEKKFKDTSCIVTDEKFSKEYTTCSYENAEECYEYFKSVSRRALEFGNNLVVIDTTMSNIEQNKYYVALANKKQYVVLVVPPVVVKNSGYQWPKGSLAESFRNKGQTVIQPTNMFQHLFCAWYLHDVDSHELRHNASLYIHYCLEEIPGFNNLMYLRCFRKGPNGEELSLIDAVRQYYCLTDKRQGLAFCPVKIFGSSMESVNDYFRNPTVQSAYGEMCKLYIAGYYISPYMIAAQVKLTDYQKLLWEMEDEMSEYRIKYSPEKPVGPWKLFEDSKKDLDDVEVYDISCKSNKKTLINSGENVRVPLKNIHPLAKGRACHIVLGKTAGAFAHNVDFSIQLALNRASLEERASLEAKAEVHILELERCVVKQNGEEWYIYLRENMCVNGLFASCVKPFPLDGSIAS